MYAAALNRLFPITGSHQASDAAEEPRSRWRPWLTGCPDPGLGCLKPRLPSHAGDT
jgi:hypothetical protein